MQSSERKMTSDHRELAEEHIDRYLGARIRTRRLLLGMSQEALGVLIGVSYQQVQRYESGVNRLSVSRLCTIAHAFDTQVSVLLGAVEVDCADHSEQEMFDGPSGKELLLAFYLIENKEIRDKLFQFVQSLGLRI